jgi:hypothetical protein
MAVFKSQQLSNIESVPSVQNSARDEDARSRVMVYQSPVTIAGLVATDTIRLGTLRKGWRLRGMQIVIPVNWLAATATISIGVTGTAGKYLTAGVVGAAAVQLDANNTAALFYGEVLAADTELVATINTAGAGSVPTAIAIVLVNYTRD